MEESKVTQPISPVPPPPTMTVSKRKFYLFGGTALCLILLILGVLGVLYMKNTKPAVLATVNKQPVYSSYLDQELALYPGSKSAETTKMLTRKIIDDQVILEAGKKEGIIKDYPGGKELSTQAYLERTEKVATIKAVVTAKEDSVDGELVSIWFYNNGYIGPEGYEKSQQIALAKISALYDRVKKKEITMKQAGEIIVVDTSLKSLDPAYIENAYTTFNRPPGSPITFWRTFDEQIHTLKPGELTTVYLGDSSAPDGKPTRDGVYMFGQVTKKTTNAGYDSFEAWLDAQKEDDTIHITSLIPLVFADDDNNNTSYNAEDDSGSYLYNSACGHGCPPFSGVVLTKTGAPVMGAIVTQTNKPGQSRQTTTNENGEYSFIAESNYNCGTSPMKFTVAMPGDVIGSVNPFLQLVYAADATTSATPIPSTRPISPSGVECGEVVKPIGNLVSLQPVSPIQCNVVGPTPTPKLVCGNACQTPTDCEGAKDGCSMCLPNAAGKKVCAPAACGMTCEKNAQCAGAKDGCSLCQNNTCQTSSCGAKCDSQKDCEGDKNGCAICKPNTQGVDVCQAKTADDMCKCDGMDIESARGKTFFPGDDVTFIAFAKVEGEDIKKADLQSMSFSLYESTLSNPNTATRIAQSSAITPQIIQNDPTKVRYKVTWNQKMPATVPTGTLYRLQATIKCAKKPGVLGVKTHVLAASDEIPAGNQQQAKTFSPGSQIQEKSCTMIKFFFN